MVWCVVYAGVEVSLVYLGHRSSCGGIGGACLDSLVGTRKDRKGELRLLVMSSQPWQSTKLIERLFAGSLQNHHSKMFEKSWWWKRDK